jgi:N-acyl-D-aspartate/D-glutamate deacylase
LTLGELIAKHMISRKRRGQGRGRRPREEREVAKAYDLVIRGGEIVDGRGGAPRVGDVAVRGGRIAAVGEVPDSGAEEIDARGRLVTPGFVDLHTHYDGHATWTDRLSGSAEHGVTTVVAGNCGVGFAPCRPEAREQLVHLMEGVEDIPEVVMTEGLPWDWETFPDYMDRLAARRFDIDVAVQLPHAPLRVFVMGRRALTREPATPEDIAEMRRLACEAAEAGALGFSTSRNIMHMALDGTVTPSYAATADELAGIAQGLKDAGRGVLQISSDFRDPASDLAIMRRMMAASQRPLSYCLVQMHNEPAAWQGYMDAITAMADEGFRIKAQVSSRFLGVFLGLRLMRNPFMRTPGYHEIEDLPFAERLARLREPERRARILAEMPGDLSAMERTFIGACEGMYEFAGDYEPATPTRIGERARVLGVDPVALAYDILTAGEGDAVLCAPLANYAEGNSAHIETMMRHPHTVPGNGDAGAHLGLIFDASMTTHLIARWSSVGRGTIPIERVVERLTRASAETVGLEDRGVVAPGYRADLNVIDPTRLAIGRHRVENDLPGGRGRLHQPASGYDATIVAGEVAYRDGVATGALAGRLVRGAQPAPVR